MIPELVQFSMEFTLASIYALCYSAVVAATWIVVSRSISWTQQWRQYWIAGLVCATTPAFYFLFPELNLLPVSVEYPALEFTAIPLDTGHVFQYPHVNTIPVLELFSLSWMVIYLAGLSIKAIALLMNYQRLRQTVIQAVEPGTAEKRTIEKAVTSSFHYININKLTVLVSSQVGSPFVSGVLKPVMVLPRDIFTLLNERQLKLVIDHELVHLKYRDPLIIGLIKLICVLFWFNPFISALSRRLQLATELSCDARVLSLEPGFKTIYAEAILKVLDLTRKRNAGATSHTYATLIDRRMDMLKQRLNRIASPINHTGISTGLVSCIYILVVSTVLTGFLFQPVLSLAQSKGWIKPLGEFGHVSSRFGPRTDPFTKRRGNHGGIDFAAPRGTSVYAVADGVIQSTKVEQNYGKNIIITHRQGLVTRYAQLDSILVQPGQHVTQGELIGEVGSSGRATGPHLHFEVIADEVNVDPASYLPENLYKTK